MFNTKYWNAVHIAFLLVMALLCFWPLTFGVFSAKNDNITQFLPVRFNVSEALRAGHLPLWSPYIYLGYPIHGDMQGGAWNPIVWILSLFSRYDLTSLHAEILCYVFLAGAGMYRLLGAINILPSIKIIGALAYTMCGYITDVGGSNLPFLAAAAYTPFVLAYYYHLLKSFDWRYALKTAVALWLLFVSAYPAFFIITCYILASAFIIFIIKLRWQKKNVRLLQYLQSHAILIIGFLLLSAPAILSYWQILPHYQRGNGVGLTEALQNSFHPSCSASFLFPSVPIKDASSFSTDLISKNGYFNCLLIVFLLCYAWMKKSILFNFALAGIVFFFLFSLGEYTPIRAWCYQLLPLMNTFRHPSNARLFLIVAAIILGIGVFQSFAEGRLQRKYPIIISMLLLGAILISVIFSFAQTTIVQKISNLTGNTSGFRTTLKNFFDSLTLHDVLILNGIVQIVFLVFLFFALRKFSSNLRWITGLFIFNSFLFAQFTIPYTLVSKESPGTINTLIHNFPKGYPIPDKTKSIAENSIDATDKLQSIGISSFYNKKIGTTEVAFTPTFMNAVEKVSKDTVLNKKVVSAPYAYFADAIQTSNDSLLLNSNGQREDEFELKEFWNNGFGFVTTVKDSSFFVCNNCIYLDGKQPLVEKKHTFTPLILHSWR